MSYKVITFCTVPNKLFSSLQRCVSPQKRNPVTSPAKTPKKRSSDGTPTKLSSQQKSVSYRPVVIILEDLESFAPSILQDFIAICRLARVLMSYMKIYLCFLL